MVAKTCLGFFFNLTRHHIYSVEEYTKILQIKAPAVKLQKLLWFHIGKTLKGNMNCPIECPKFGNELTNPSVLDFQLNVNYVKMLVLSDHYLL